MDKQVTRSEPGIVLVHISERPERVVRLLRDRRSPEDKDTIHWLFLGHDYQTVLSWENVLGSGFQRLDISQSLEKTAGQLRAPFISWVDDLNRQYGDDPDWWFTQISERHTLISPLFLHVCYLALARKYLSGEKRSRVIVAESWGLIESLRILCLAGGIGVVVLGTWHKWIELIRQPIRVLLAWGTFIVHSWRRYHAARTTLGNAPLPSFSASGQSVVLLDTFVLESNLLPDGVFRDSFFPFLHEWLAEHGHQVWVLPTVAYVQSSITNVYRRMRNSTTRFLIPEDWLRLSDYVPAFRCSIKGLVRPLAVSSISGLNIQRLVTEERWAQSASRRSMEACLLSRIPVRLREAGFTLSLILNWFENQIIDKALVLGCNRAFPGVSHTGVQNTPLFPYLLNLFPTAVECNAGVIPNRIVCSGPLHQQILANQSQGQLQVVVGCGLRYGYLWDQSREKRAPFTQHSTSVLVALPNPLSIAVAILDLVLPLCLERANVTWYVKPHPDYSLQALKRAMANRKIDCLTFVDGVLRDWMNRVDVVVTTGSGAALEAAASGIPVILVGSRTTLNYNPLAWFNGQARSLCYTSEEISHQLDKFANLDLAAQEQLYQAGQEILRSCFAPVTEDGLRQFLE